MLLLLVLVLPWPTTTSFAEQVKSCAAPQHDGKVCSLAAGDVCRNGSCVSACAERGLQRCRCADEDDDYCYLCCGSSSTECQPAHRLSVLRPNGEYWERDACRRCRSPVMNGLHCDDTQPDRLCHGQRCSDRVCLGRAAGEYCDKSEEHVCMDGRCQNPCAQGPRKMLVCECPETDQRTGMASDDRCQLCCFDFTAKRCQSAFFHFGIKNKDGRPLPRTGLSCRSGTKQCSPYGICAACRAGNALALLAVALAAKMLL